VCDFHCKENIYSLIGIRDGAAAFVLATEVYGYEIQAQTPVTALLKR